MYLVFWFWVQWRLLFCDMLVGLYHRRRVAARVGAEGRGRGGWQQRVRAAERAAEAEAAEERAEREGPPPRMSRLARGHLLDWCDGITSASKFETHMSDEIADQRYLGQEPHPMVARLATIGSGPHAHAGLRRLLADQGLLALQTPLLDPEFVSTMVLPSTIVRTLHTHYPTAFKVVLGADTMKLRSFWERFLARPRTRAWADNHPFLRGKPAAELVTTIPATLHTDSGPATKTKSVNIISWSSLLGAGGEKESKLVICSCVKESTRGDAPAWHKIIGDFDGLAEGVVDGVAVAQDGRRRWRVVLLIAKMDEEARCNEMGLAHFNSPQCCSDCLADAAALPYTDLRLAAAWRPTVAMTFAMWLARLRAPLHPLAASHYCCDRLFFLDLMHLGDCNGFTNTILGSVLKVAMTKITLGANMAARLERFNTFRKDWYDRHDITNRLPKLRLQDLVADGWGELSGPAVKAANTRCAVPMVRDFAVEVFTEAGAPDTEIVALLTDLKEFYEILYGAQMFLEDHELTRLDEVIPSIGVKVQRLRAWARARELLVFQVKPKMHKLQHLLLYAEALNPRHVQNYLEESLIGTVTKIWHIAMRGNYVSDAQSNVLLRRTLGLLLRWEEM